MVLTAVKGQALLRLAGRSQRRCVWTWRRRPYFDCAQSTSSQSKYRRLPPLNANTKNSGVL